MVLASLIFGHVMFILCTNRASQGDDIDFPQLQYLTCMWPVNSSILFILLSILFLLKNSCILNNSISVSQSLTLLNEYKKIYPIYINRTFLPWLGKVSCTKHKASTSIGHWLYYILHCCWNKKKNPASLSRLINCSRLLTLLPSLPWTLYSLRQHFIFMHGRSVTAVFLCHHKQGVQPLLHSVHFVCDYKEIKLSQFGRL